MTVEAGGVLRNHVKEKLARGEVVASMTVRLVRGIEIARIAKTAGFDSLYVDMEHSSFSLETTSQICMAALETGITPFVRVPSAADLKFLHRPPQSRSGTSNRKAALASNTC
jgi:4-hydroxy-2-oxoheptanedioate aldolase